MLRIHKDQDASAYVLSWSWSPAEAGTQSEESGSVSELIVTWPSNLGCGAAIPEGGGADNSFPKKDEPGLADHWILPTLPMAICAVMSLSISLIH